jgi:hypothetical protein
MVSRTSAARPSAPLRKSTGVVATSTRTDPVGPITCWPSTLAEPPRPSWLEHHVRSVSWLLRSPPRCCQSFDPPGVSVYAAVHAMAAPAVSDPQRPERTSASQPRSLSAGALAGAR